MSVKKISKPSKPEKYISIAAVGDVMPGGIFSERLDEFEYKWLSPQIRSQLDSDIVFCNLECPLLDTCTPSSDKSGLHAKEKAIQAIRHGNFNVVSLANNHMMDYGHDGLLQTLKLLDQNNIKYAGAGITLDEARKPAMLEARGVSVGMHAYISPFYFRGTLKTATENSPGLAPFDIEMAKKDIKSTKKECDIVIVSIHWGIENTYYVPPKNIKMAREILNAGADIIWGHHPHIVQGYEIYKDKIALYSLGNFLFPALGGKGHWEKKHRTSIIFKCVMTKNGKLIDHDFIPVLQEDDNNPILTIPTEEYSNKVLHHIQKWTKLYSQPYYPLEFNFGYRKEKLRNIIRSMVVHIKQEGFINTFRKKARIKKHLSDFIRAT